MGTTTKRLDNLALISMYIFKLFKSNEVSESLEVNLEDAENDKYIQLAFESGDEWSHLPISLIHSGMYQKFNLLNDFFKSSQTLHFYKCPHADENGDETVKTFSDPQTLCRDIIDEIQAATSASEQRDPDFTSIIY